MMMTRIILAIPLCMILSAGLHAQQHHASARDTFWSASDLVAVAPNPAVHRVASKSPKAKPAKQSSDDGMVGDTSSAQTTPPAGHPSAMQLVSENGYGAAPHLVRTSESKLGLRYSVLLRDPDGQYAEVSPDATFHSGDRIRLSLMANEPGYLYVIEQGSSGNWTPLFPKAGSAADANRIEPGTVQQIPGKAHFEFNQQVGEEKLFVILSRTPIHDLDQRIESLKGKKPASSDQPIPPPDGQLLEAENHIPDVFVQQLASRDLTLVDEEKVDDAATANHGGEKAVYVVSKSVQGNDSEVVASIKLTHK